MEPSEIQISEPKPRAYSAFLIENELGLWLCDSKSTPHASFTSDPLIAIKFLFREDAERAVTLLKDYEDFGTFTLKVTEHSWGHMDEVVLVELSEKESQLLDERRKNHDMSRSGVMRRALRILSMFDAWVENDCKIEVRDKDGEIVYPFEPMGCPALD